MNPFINAQKNLAQSARVSAFPFALLGSALLGTFACSESPVPVLPSDAQAGDDDKSEGERANNALQGQFVKARPLAKVASLAAPATVVAAPSARYWVTPPFMGRVHSLEVQAGDVVEKGQKLASVVLPSLAQYAAQYLTAAEKVATLKAQSERLEKLRQAGLARAAERSAAKVALAEATGELRSAKAAFASAGLSVNAASSLVEHGGFYTLRAPHAGVVEAIFSAPGAPASSENPLLEIASKAPVRVQASLPPGVLHGAFSGFSFVAQGSSGKRVVPLALHSSSPQIDLATGSQKAWFVANPTTGDAKENVELPPGTVGYLRPTAASPLWVVPADALSLKGDVFQVEVRTSTGMSFVEVKPLATTHGLSIVQGITKAFDVAVRAPAEVIRD